MSSFDPEHKTVYELVQALRTYAESWPVRFDFANEVDGNAKWFGAEASVNSYRGYYEDLSIEPTLDGEWAWATAGELCVTLKARIGTVIEGYKGGEYTVMDDTVVWASAWGESSGLMIVGVTFDHNTNHVVLLTRADD